MRNFVEILEVIPMILPIPTMHELNIVLILRIPCIDGSRRQSWRTGISKSFVQKFYRITFIIWIPCFEGGCNLTTTYISCLLRYMLCLSQFRMVMSKKNA